MLEKANPFLYQALHLENRRSGEHRGEHVATGLRICVSDVTRRRLIRIECPIHNRILVPLVLQIVDLVVRVGIRKMQLSNQNRRSKPNAGTPMSDVQIGCTRIMSPVIERAISVSTQLMASGAWIGWRGAAPVPWEKNGAYHTGRGGYLGRQRGRLPSRTPDKTTSTLMRRPTLAQGSVPEGGGRRCRQLTST